jgi:protein-tyrosine phosphatase
VTELYWIDGPWPGRLAISARPRGGDWLGDEMKRWHTNGVDTVISLLTSSEAEQLELQDEGLFCRRNDMDYISFPVEDRMVPASDAAAIQLIEKLDAALVGGKNIVVHCRQGVGRSGLIAASLLIERGLSVPKALERVSAARGAEVPETPEQLGWIASHASALTDAGERKP